MQRSESETQDAIDARRWRSVKAKHCLALTRLATGESNYSSVKTPAVLDAWADLAFAEIDALEANLSHEDALPNIEIVSSEVHQAWVNSNATQGTISRTADDGEELMLPYSTLSEKAKDLDRVTVQAVYSAIRRLRIVKSQ